jgi:hypothetical protein
MAAYLLGAAAAGIWTVPSVEVVEQPEIMPKSARAAAAFREVAAMWDNDICKRLPD